MRSFLTVCVLAGAVGLGGCGGCNDNNSVGHLPDAPPAPDAAPDSMPPDAVSLVILNHGVPAVGVPVYFLNADGSVANAAVTDGNGIASAVVTQGGSVTAVRPFTTEPPPAGKFTPDELRTFLGVKPGDHLVLSRAAVDTVTATVDAAAPTDGDFGTHYDVFTTCSNGGTIEPGQSGNGSASPDPGGPVALDNCHGTADLAVLATQPAVAARAGAHPSALAAPQSLYHANQNLPPGDTPVPVSLRGDAYAAPTTVMLTYSNTPDAEIDVLHAPILPHGNLGPFSITAGPGTASLLEPTVPATTAIVDSTLTLNSRHEIVDWGPFVASYSLDMTGVLLREVTAGPAYDLAAGRISWTEAADGATPDLTIVGILVRRPDPLAKWHWEIAAPYAAAGIVLPHLPTDAFNWMPNDTDEIDLDPVKTVKMTGGYDAVREHILDIHDETGPTGYVIGDHGRAVTMTSMVVAQP
ncbi:MAG TPA: hypothetical protein VHW23_35065 [Kofleriaceae bacterium]|nr:hypothetical protein [Kofleriaceae bacterium]